jgi:purine-nucleoside phosphorylase
VLIAEQLFASGCRLLLSLTSAGQITASATPPYCVVIDRALRDEETSYNYAAPAEYGEADPGLFKIAANALCGKAQPVLIGSTWTTDAPFRETADAIEMAKSKGALAVEMEAAALYAFVGSTKTRVLCLAHVTNTMGQAGDDFEKGEADGTRDALGVLARLVAAFGRL